jgi:hypothetical protein
VDEEAEAVAAAAAAMRAAACGDVSDKLTVPATARTPELCSLLERLWL